jgi:hypothetical protein
MQRVDCIAIALLWWYILKSLDASLQDGEMRTNITAQTDTLDTALGREEMLVQRLGAALEGKNLAWCSVSD